MPNKKEPYKKIKNVVEKVIEPSIRLIRKKNMPYKDIAILLKVFFPRIEEIGKGAFKRVYIIHFNKRKFVLKIGRKRKHIRKDFTTYTSSFPKNKRNRYFAKIYWRKGLFMLQKFGKNVNVPKLELKKLKVIGRKYGLKDVRAANIMKFGNKFKIVDAERKKHEKKKNLRQKQTN